MVSLFWPASGPDQDFDASMTDLDGPWTQDARKRTLVAPGFGWVRLGSGWVALGPGPAEYTHGLNRGPRQFIHGSSLALVVRRRNLGTFDTEADLSAKGLRLPQALEVCVRTCKPDTIPRLCLLLTNGSDRRQEFPFVLFQGLRPLPREGPGRRSQSALYGDN